MTASRTGRLLAAVVRVSTRRPLVTVVLSFALTLLAVAYTTRDLGFLTEHLGLLPQRERYVALLREYQRDFGELGDIVVVIAAPEPAAARQYAERLTGALARQLPSARVAYRVDPRWTEERGLLYLSVDELTRLRDRLFDAEELLAAYAARPSLEQLLTGLNQAVGNAMTMGIFDLGLGGQPEADVRLLDSVLGQMAARLDGDTSYTSPWAVALSTDRPGDAAGGWFFSSNQRLLFLFVRPAAAAGEFERNREQVLAVRAVVQSLATAFPDVRTGVTGSPAVATDEMAGAFADSNLSSAIAFIATFALLLLAFRRIGAPVMMTLTLMISLVWALGLVTLLVGRLNIFSIMFVSIVVGIGIDYGIYFLYRYDEERALGAPVPAALERTALFTGPGILLGALTAAGTFLVLVLTHFQGIREFGLVSTLAIAAAFAAMLTLFPALLVLTDRRHTVAPPEGGRGLPPEAGWLERFTRRRWTILLGTAAASALAIVAARHVEFDYNMLKLQAKGAESVAWEERILAEAGRSGFAAVATASGLDDLQRKTHALSALSTVSEVESLLRLVPDRQPEKIALIGQFAPLVEPVRLAPEPPLDPSRLREPLQMLRRRLGFVVGAAPEGRLPAVFGALLARLDALQAKVGSMPPERVAAALTPLQTAIARDFGETLQWFQQSLAPRPITPEELPPEVRARYVGASGRLLIRIHPAVDFWEREGAARFVGELRSVDPDVTGPPVTAFESIHLIRQGYLEGTLYAFALVAVVSGVLLRSVRAVALALTPLVLGVLWTLGLMGVLGLDFTLANVWAMPLIIGAAAEYGLTMYVRFQEGRESGGPLLPRSGVLAVFLNGLTTMTGFGCLMVAQHQGIFGLGLLLTIGATVSLVSSLIVLPVLIRMFAPKGPSTALG